MAETKKITKKPALSGEPKKTDNRGKVIKTATQAYKGKNPQGFIKALVQLKPIDTSDTKALYKRLQEVLDICEKYESYLQNQALYFALGIDKDTASDWKHRRAGSGTSNTEQANEKSRFIKYAQGICALSRETFMAKNPQYASAGIFWQKNYDGLKDVQEVITTPNGGEFDGMSEAEILEARKKRLGL